MSYQKSPCPGCVYLVDCLLIAVSWLLGDYTFKPPKGVTTILPMPTPLLVLQITFILSQECNP